MNKNVPRELEGLPLFKKIKEEADKYMLYKEVGFYVTDKSVKFISTTRHCLNYDWSLNYDDIYCIAFGNGFFVDDDDDYIIFLCNNQEPIYFNTPGYGSEEWQGFDDFILMLKNKIGFEVIDWKYDTAIIAYPKQLRGKKLYQSWNESLESFLNMVSRKLGIKHEMSGVVKYELQDLLIKE